MPGNGHFVLDARMRPVAAPYGYAGPAFASDPEPPAHGIPPNIFSCLSHIDASAM
jgi:hypothetical protein